MDIVHVIALIDMALFGAAVITIHVFTYLWIISLVQRRHALVNLGTQSCGCVPAERN